MKAMDDKEILDMVCQLTDEYRSHWNTIYTKDILDYRLMSEGKLPASMEAELTKLEYKYDSALVPRMIINANSNIKAMIVNSIFNRSKRIDFIGRIGKEDHERANSVNELVDQYAFEVTEVEKTVEEIIEDALETGIGYGEVEYLRKNSPVMRMERSENNGDLGEYLYGTRESEPIYDGGYLKYIRTELVAPEPVRRAEYMTAYSRLAVTPISDIMDKAINKTSSFYKYRNNIEKIKSGDFVDVEAEYDTNNDHGHELNHFATPDFKVMLDIFWAKIRSKYTKGVEWHRITVANYKTNPMLLEIIPDPMRTGSHPLILGRVFPRNNRLMGFAAPELLFDLFLEKYAKRNQRINYMNVAIELAGMLVVPQGTITGKSNILAKRGKIVSLSGNGSPKDITTIQMDMSPMAMTMQEEQVIDVDVEETLQSSKVSRGQMPSRQEKATTVAIVDENSKILQSLPIKHVENTIIKPTGRLYLNLFQNFSAQQFIIRILGKGGYMFKEIARGDFMGYFDVKCYASSEILPKALKQAAFAQMAQVYGANPRCNIDIDKLAYAHGEALELNMGEFIDDRGKDRAEIEREESIMLVLGRPIPPLEHEPHIFHITEHMTTLQDLLLKGVKPEDDNYRALQMHIEMTKQMMAEINGQVNIPTQSNPHNIGEAINNTSAVSAPKGSGV